MDWWDLAPILWPARSPDLTWMDFFCWGYLKSKVYTDQPQANLQALRERIIEEMQALPQDMMGRAIHNFILRINVCIERNGRIV